MVRHAVRTRSRRARWRDVILSTDPGLYNLRSAARATLGLAACAALLMTVGARWGASISTALVGGEMAMIAAVAISDPLPSARRVTLLICLPVAICSIALATWMAGSIVLEGALLCAITFAAVVARRIGPRGTAAGFFAFLSCFVALFVQAKPSDLPLLAATVVVAGAIAYVIQFWILPERPSHVRENVLVVFRARARLMLDAVVRGAASGAGEPSRRFRRDVGLLNEMALALEAAVGRTDSELPVPDARDWVAAILRAEVALDFLADAVHCLASESATNARLALVDLVRAVQRWIDSPEHPDALSAQLEVVRTELRPTVTDEDAAAVWWRLTWAVETLGAARPWQRYPDVGPDVARLSVMTFRPGGGGWAGVKPVSSVWPELRLAAQATIAIGLSIVAGYVISPARWYWAVLAAYVVFVRSATVGETVSRAWQRLLGTVVGVTVGLGVASLVGREARMATVVGLAAVFLAYWLLRVSYTGMIACFTIALVLLYESMRRPLLSLMELRVGETLAGAAIGVAVSALVFPTHSRARVRNLLAALMRDAAPAIRRVSSAGVDAATDQVLREAIRAVDRALAEVRNAVRPLWAPSVPYELEEVRHRGRAASLLAYRVRRFVAAPLLDEENGRRVQRIGEQLARNCERAADVLDGAADADARGLSSPTSLIDELRQNAGAEPARLTPWAVMLSAIDELIDEVGRADAQA